MPTGSDKNVGADLEAYREEFPTLAKKIYLNTCSLGALSRRSHRAVNEFLALWEEWGASAWYEIWLGKLDELRESFARLIGAQAHEIAILPHVSAALSAIASSLDYKKRPKVVLTALDFPTVGHQWWVKRSLGVEVEILPSPDGVRVPLEAYERAVDGRTALVATSRVFFTSGYIQDIGAITEIAHARGAYVLVDDYQGTGQVPIDVKALNVDMLVTGGLKWLLGGPGIAFLYVREDLIEKLEPTVTGWFAARDQFDFRVDEFLYREDARRFESGTPALAAVYAAAAGLEIVHEIGPPALRERTSFLTEHLIEGARRRGLTLRVADRAEERAGIVMLPMDDPASVVRKLAERDIIVDSRPGALRISPYFYNTPEENEIVLDAVCELTSSSR